MLTMYTTPSLSYSFKVVTREITGLIEANPEYDLGYYVKEMSILFKRYEIKQGDT